MSSAATSIISAAIFFAFSTMRAAQTFTLGPPTGIERELNVPCPAWTCFVSPCTTSMLSGGICRASAAICASTVACP
jgi:hypothetical protein